MRSQAWRSRAAPLLALCSSLALLGCDVESPGEATESPAPRVLSVRASTGVTADGDPLLERIDVAAPKAVLTTSHFELSFDRFLAPRDVSRQALCLRSAPEPVSSYEDCIGGVALRPSYDPVRRVARFYLDSPSARLAPDTLYTLTVHAPRGELDLGFRAFDGAPLETRLELRFRTDGDRRIEARADAPPEGKRYCSDESCVRRCGGDALCVARCAPGAREVLRTSCAGARCHGGRAEEGAAMGLVLDDVDGLLSTAIEKVAHQTQVGPDADTPKVNPVRFGSQMMLIAPGDAGSSYLLYKLLLDPALQTEGGLAQGELDRLRSFVVGMPMPLAGERSALVQARAISDWIAAGADVEACP